MLSEPDGERFDVVGIDVGFVNLAIVRVDAKSHRVIDGVHINLKEPHEADSEQSNQLRAMELQSRLGKQESRLTMADWTGLLADALQRPEVSSLFQGVRAVAIEQQQHTRNERQKGLQAAIIAVLKQRTRDAAVAIHVVPANAVKSFFKGLVFDNAKRHAVGVTVRHRYRMDKKSAVDYAWRYFPSRVRAGVRKRDDLCDAYLIALYYYQRVILRADQFLPRQQLVSPVEEVPEV